MADGSTHMIDRDALYGLVNGCRPRARVEQYQRTAEGAIWSLSDGTQDVTRFSLKHGVLKDVLHMLEGPTTMVWLGWMDGRIPEPTRLYMLATGIVKWK